MATPKQGPGPDPRARRISDCAIAAKAPPMMAGETEVDRTERKTWQCGATSGSPNVSAVPVESPLRRR